MRSHFFMNAPCRIKKVARAYNNDMKRKDKENEINPIDQMIQANKDESEESLRLWGKKARKHILPNPKKAK